MIHACMVWSFLLLQSVNGATGAPHAQPSPSVEQCQMVTAQVAAVRVPEWSWEARPGVYPNGKPVRELAGEGGITVG